MAGAAEVRCSMGIYGQRRQQRGGVGRGRGEAHEGEGGDQGSDKVALGGAGGDVDGGTDAGGVGVGVVGAGGAAGEGEDGLQRRDAGTEVEGVEAAPGIEHGDAHAHHVVGIGGVSDDPKATVRTAFLDQRLEEFGPPGDDAHAGAARRVHPGQRPPHAARGPQDAHALLRRRQRLKPLRAAAAAPRPPRQVERREGGRRCCQRAHQQRCRKGA